MKIDTAFYYKKNICTNSKFGEFGGKCCANNEVRYIVPSSSVVTVVFTGCPSPSPFIATTFTIYFVYGYKLLAVYDTALVMLGTV